MEDNGALLELNFPSNIESIWYQSFGETRVAPGPCLHDTTTTPVLI